MFWKKRVKPNYQVRAYEEDVFKWHHGYLADDDPLKKKAIFVVHGMGQQTWAETAANLRVHVEDVLEDLGAEEILPAPFIQEGFWANYDDIEKTFPEEWKKLEESKKSFFKSVWLSRSISKFRTFFWFLKQLPKLIFSGKVWKFSGFYLMILYFLLAIFAIPLFLILLLFFPRVLSEVLNDVRLYCEPRGMVERAIVQRIDKRVGEAFLRLIGLDWNFEPVNNPYMIDGKPVVFEKVYWVAHSLGSVVSYNVLSDLFTRADDLIANGSPEQQEGVVKFWDSLMRFITIGSPLDKIAVLFGNKVLRPWPSRFFQPTFVEHNESGSFLQNWWVNFFHHLDPVSGALSHPLICPPNLSPNNYHLDRFWRIPGLAHIAYWKDTFFLKYLLTRYFGSLNFYRPKPKSKFSLMLRALVAYFTWLALIVGPICAFIFYPDELISALIKIWDLVSRFL